MMTQFQNINGFPNYLITDNGEVISLGNPKSNNQYKKSRTLRQMTDRYGYLKLTLCNDGKKVQYLVHRLVAKAFIPNPSNKKTINHKDRNKKNNNTSNLEWMTNEENISEDGKFIKRWESGGLAVKELDLWSSAISKCCKGRSKRHGGFKWTYADR